MKKYLKKFGIMFVMTLILSLGFCISAFADDNSLAGVANLDGTTGITQNSAKVGDQLTAPEVGWTRYDDTNSKVIRNGNGWGEYTQGIENQFYFNNTQWYSKEKGDSYIFEFYGSKLRLINPEYTTTGKVKITIDGNEPMEVDMFKNISAPQTFTISYENIDLSQGYHIVKIENIDGTSLVSDAIDIDSDGYLVYPNESISLDQSSMNLNVGDSQQLTATTTPAAVGVTWTSSDTSIATVDSNGNVTGVKEGTCTITATTADGLTATCIVTVSPKGTEPSNPPTGDANLYIELVDGQIKQYNVSSDEINKFTEWYENRDKDHSLKATYKFTKGTYTDYVVHDQIDWFEVR
jgi:uncharacterized protein YjdB